MHIEGTTMWRGGKMSLMKRVLNSYRENITWLECEEMLIREMDEIMDGREHRQRIILHMNSH